MRKAKQGDIIQWKFGENDGIFSGKTFSAEVAMIDDAEKCYGVYVEYGQDLIPFDEAEIISIR